jgi:hypothetical protein
MQSFEFLDGVLGWIVFLALVKFCFSVVKSPFISLRTQCMLHGESDLGDNVLLPIMLPLMDHIKRKMISIWHSTLFQLLTKV